jgi:hypothetical protein
MNSLNPKGLRRTRPASIFALLRMIGGLGTLLLGDRLTRALQGRKAIRKTKKIGPDWYPHTSRGFLFYGLHSVSFLS